MRFADDSCVARLLGMARVAEDKISASSERRPFAHPLIVHDDLIDNLSEDSALGRRLKLVFSQLAANGRTSIVKGCKDSINRGWQRTPVSGNNRYLWWCHHDSDHAATLGLAQRSIVIRTVRHHDDHAPLKSGVRNDYIDWQPSDQASGQLPWTDRQKKFIYDEAPIRILNGNPGSGKTTALWEAICARDAQSVLYLTWSSRLAEMASAHLESFAGKGVKFIVRDLRSFLGELLGRDIQRVDMEQSVRLFRQHIARLSVGDIGDWRRLPVGLYSEVRACVYGRGSPNANDLPLGRPGRNEYLSARRSELGAAADAVVKVVESIEETLNPDQWIPDLLAAADVSRLMASSSAERILKRAGIHGVDRIVIDEAQDLTLLELRALMDVYGAIAERKQSLPFLLLAGDEGQTVVPTQFAWGPTKDVVYEKVQTLVENPRDLTTTHKLETNLRCPRNVCQLLEQASDLYTGLPKVSRPGDQVPPSDMQIHDARVVHAINDDDEDAFDVLETLVDQNGVAVLSLNEGGENGDTGSLSDVILRTSDAKGLEYQSVCVLNPGRSLARIGKLASEAGPLSTLMARTAIDQLRVALSRATGDLVFFDVNGTPEEVAESSSFLSKPVQTDAEGLRKFFADAHHDPEDRVRSRLELAASVEDTDLRRSWRLCLECWRMLGDANVTNGVSDALLRGQVQTTVLRLASRLIVSASADASFKEHIEESVASMCTPETFDVFRPFWCLVEWHHADSSGIGHAETIKLVHILSDTSCDAEWIKPAVDAVAQRLRTLLVDCASDHLCAAAFTGPVGRWLEVTGQVEGTSESAMHLRSLAFDCLLTNGKLEDADSLLVHFPDDLPKHARRHEASGDHVEAARLFERCNSFPEALRNWRHSGRWEEALRLASAGDREKLSWLKALEENLKAKPDGLDDWLQPAEKKRLKALLSGK